MVGGGRGSQIGYVHRSAALRDRTFDLVAGAFDLDPERGRAFGVELGLDPARCYPDYRALFAGEAARSDGIQAVSVATPNNTHYEITKAALEHGLHVVCEKPLCFTTAEAEELAALAKARNKIVGVTYGYAGHQLIEQAREMVAAGELGEIRLVNLQFAHGFHSAPVEEKNPATRWRVDPRFAGPSYVLGDIGTHPLYISEVILPHLRIKRLMCARQSFVKSRAPLEDNAVTLMEYDNGAFGTVWSSAVNAGVDARAEGADRRLAGLARMVGRAPEPAALRGPGPAGPHPRARHGLPARPGARRRPDRRRPSRRACSRPGPISTVVSPSPWRRPTRATPSGCARCAIPTYTAGVEGVRWVENCVRSADLGGVWIDYA